MPNDAEDGSPLGDRSDEAVVLTLPGDGRFVTVARLVVGGLAARLDLPYESVDDLQLAVETIASEYGTGEDVTLRMVVDAGSLEVQLTPVDDGRIRTELDGGSGSLGLGLLLSRVVDAVAFEDRDGSRWLRLVKKAPIGPRR